MKTEITKDNKKHFMLVQTRTVRTRKHTLHNKNITIGHCTDVE